MEVVQAVADSTQSYAVYLPSRYDRTKRWPILFLMDPRGRALVPLRLFQQAAEEHGYVVMSSYDTMSDGPREPNEAAIQAMVSDALVRLAIDTHRLYMVGFSGTVREAWGFASRIPDHVAAVIGSGAGLPGDRMELQAIKADLHPGDAACVCWFRARAFAQAGRVSDALEEIACLGDAGAADPSLVEEDPYLESILDDARFHDLVERMRRSTSREEDGDA